MARSTYIYVVLAELIPLPLATFTVKHELVTWLRRNRGDYTIWRMSDGAHREPTNITKEFALATDA